MNRRSAKTLRAILAAGIIATMVGTVQVKAAALSVDEIYANSYLATDNVMNIKTQKSINEARIAIEALRDTGADWAIGEFSKQVDQVLNPFLVKIINAINKAEQTGKQEDINAAKTSIEPELLQIWKNSYSSAIDKIQQKLMKQLIDAADVTELPELTSDTVKSIKVYDENNMPNDIKSKLALYQQNAEKLLSDAEAQIS